jgi:hypothetical protein
MSSPFAVSQQDRLIRFSADRHLPTVYFAEEFADVGGLMSHGPSYRDAYRRAASYVDKILKGAKPGDLPVQQPTTFKLVINLEDRERAWPDNPAIAAAARGRGDPVIFGITLGIRAPLHGAAELRC